MNTVLQGIASTIVKTCGDIRGNLFITFPPHETFDADSVVHSLLECIYRASPYQSEQYSDVCLQLGFPLQEDGRDEQSKFFDAPYAACKYRNNVAVFAIDVTRLIGQEKSVDFVKLARYLASLPSMQLILYASAAKEYDCLHLTTMLTEVAGIPMQRFCVPPLNQQQLLALIAELVENAGISCTPYQPYIPSFIEEIGEINEKRACRFAEELVRTVSSSVAEDAPQVIVEAAANKLITTMGDNARKIGFI